jgi:hypothetical protein
MNLKKLFIVRKYIMATDIQHAIRLEKSHKPDDIWMDDEWRKANLPDPNKPRNPIGYEKDGGTAN